MKKFKKGVLAIGVLAAAAVIAAGCGKKDAKTTNETKKEPTAPVVNANTILYQLDSLGTDIIAIPSIVITIPEKLIQTISVILG